MDSNLTIEGTTLIAVEDKSVRRIVVPDIVGVIGACAFQDCVALESVSIPEPSKSKGLVRIEVHAFGGCTSLASISLPRRSLEIDDEAFEEWTTRTK